MHFALVGERDSQQGLLGELAAEQIHPHRKTVGGEAGGHTDRRQSGRWTQLGSSGLRLANQRGLPKCVRGAVMPWDTIAATTR